jgi:hypothetical protein
MAMEPEEARTPTEAGQEPESEQLAMSLAADMMAAGVEGLSTSEISVRLSPWIALADVEADVDQFTDQYKYCSENSLSMPCFEDNKTEPLPINLAGIVYPSIRSSAVYQKYDLAQAMLTLLPEQVSEIAESSGLAYSEYSPEDARNFFSRRLRKFLVPRVKTSNAKDTRRAPHQGLRFKVHTYKSGLRVHYMPAYWFNPNQVFGSPTTPVEGWITPGRYRFGAVGRTYSLRFDDGEFDIPPAEEAHLQI